MHKLPLIYLKPTHFQLTCTNSEIANLEVWAIQKLSESYPPESLKYINYFTILWEIISHSVHIWIFTLGCKIYVNFFRNKFLNI